MQVPFHWLSGGGRERTTEDDQLRGNDHPQCQYRPISGTAMELIVAAFLRYPWSSDPNKQTNKQTNNKNTAIILHNFHVLQY